MLFDAVPSLQVLVAIYFFVAVMGCLLGIKRFEAALLLAPLAVGVLVFHALVSGGTGFRGFGGGGRGLS
jgi:hypothetical protein